MNQDKDRKVDYWREQYFKLALEAVDLADMAGLNAVAWALNHLHQDFIGAGMKRAYGWPVDFPVRKEDEDDD